MGQIIGKPRIKPSAQPFVNAPRKNISDLWEAFNLLAEGFGLSLSETKDMIRMALEDTFHHHRLTPPATNNTTHLDNLSENLFHLFDRDHHGTVDSLEFLSALALASDMAPDYKLRFIIGLYDFDEKGGLTFDELNLALRASISGLLKISELEFFSPLCDEETIKKLASVAFPKEGEDVNLLAARTVAAVTILTAEELIDYARGVPEIQCWLEHFSSIEEPSDMILPLTSPSSSSSPSSSIRTYDCGSIMEQQASYDLDVNLHSVRAGSSVVNHIDDQDYDDDTMEDTGAVDTSPAEETWKEMIRLAEPNDLVTPESVDIPSANLVLDWIYGRNTGTGGPNSFYSKKGEILYPAGAMGVKLSLDNDGEEGDGDGCSQRYFGGHSEFITCMAICPPFNTITNKNDSNDTLVATSELAPQPTIHIWSTNTLRSLQSISGFHRGGVQNLNFSPSGNLLLSVGMMDSNDGGTHNHGNSIAIYRWRDGTTLFTTTTTAHLGSGPLDCRLSRTGVLDCRFLGSDRYFGVCGHHFVDFWDNADDDAEQEDDTITVNSMEYLCHRGIFGKSFPRDTVLITCLAYVGGHVVTGGTGGMVYVWEGRSCIRAIDLHTSGTITCMYTSTLSSSSPSSVANDDGDTNDCLCAGSSDGKIFLWNDRLELTASYHIPYNNDTNTTTTTDTKHIHSICWNRRSKRLLVGLAYYSSDLLEICDVDGKYLGTVIQGHDSSSSSNDDNNRWQLTGLATNPIQESEVATVGWDGIVRVWNTEGRYRSQRNRMKIGVVGNCIAYSHDGKHLAVGVGIRRRKQQLSQNQRKQWEDRPSDDLQTDGGFIIMNAKYLTVVKSVTDEKMTPIDCKYSKDGKYLAFGCTSRSTTDYCIYLYCAKDHTPMAKAKGHSSPVTHIDFGCVRNGTVATFLQSNSLDNDEVMFWSVEGVQQPPRSQRYTQFETMTCPHSWSLKGANPKKSRSTTNTRQIQISKLTACDRSNAGTYAATVDDAGRIHLFTYPAIAKKSCLYLRIIGSHGGSVSNVRFSHGDRWIFTIGRFDGCLMQWRLDIDFHAAENITDPSRQGQRLSLRNRTLEKFRMRSTARGGKDGDNVINDSDTSSRVSPPSSLPDDNEHIRKSSVKPWQRNIVSPTDSVILGDPLLSPPSQTLNLHWIHGYNGAEGGRNNLFYGRGSSGQTQIVYPVGRTLVSYDRERQTQSFYRSVDLQEITCLALHPKQSVCAVGQMQMGVSHSPSIHCVNYGTMETLHIFKDYHYRAVTNMKFDSTGKYLVSVGMDDSHFMVVFDWENKSVLASSQTSCHMTLDIAFSMRTMTMEGGGDGLGLVQCGDGLLRFWTVQGSTLIHRDAVLGEKGKVQVFHSIGWDNTNLIVGTGDGYLYSFTGRLLDRTVKASDSAVLVIYSSTTTTGGGEGGIVTGFQDGTVKVWDPSLVCRFTVELRDFSSVDCAVRSLFWDCDENKILIGTDRNEIWELFTADDVDHLRPEVIVLGHSGKTLSGLSVVGANTNGRLVVSTTDDDKALRLWDVHSPSCSIIKSMQLELGSRACAFSPDGSMLAIGFGQPKKVLASEFHGKWIIMSMQVIDKDKDYSIIFETRDSRKMISEIKWSPNGQHIAVGSYDTNIYLYDVDFSSLSNKKKVNGNVSISLSTVVERHEFHITHLDFSLDSRYIQVNDNSYELQFYETETGLHIPAASRLKDVSWDSHTCRFGWPVQGVWSPSPSDHDDDDDNTPAVVECVDCFVDETNPSKSVLATGDSLGRVRLLRYPCLSHKARSSSSSNAFGSHVGRIGRIKWIDGGERLVSIGLDDKAIMIWNVLHDKTHIRNDDVEEAISSSLNDGTSESHHRRSVDETKIEQRNTDRPWVASMVAPSNADSYKEQQNNLPKNNLQLMTIHGFETDNYGRHLPNKNLFYNSHEEVIYSSSSLGIVYDSRTHTQRFFRKHDASRRSLISVITISPNRRMAASADVDAGGDGRPAIRIWDAHTCAHITTFGDLFHRGGIDILAFSNNGDGGNNKNDSKSTQLVSIGSEQEHRVGIWKSCSGEWLDYFLQYRVECGFQPIYFAGFLSDTFHRGGLRLVTGGNKTIQFWERKGNAFLPFGGTFNAIDKDEVLLCGTELCDSKYLTGTKSGHLLIWENQIRTIKIKAHEGAVNCLHHNFKSGLVTGGSEGRIILWSLPNLERMKDFDIADDCSSPHYSLDRAVQSVCASPSRCTSSKLPSKILIGTRGCEIYELSVPTGATIRLQESHYKGEINGLTAHPKDDDIFATCGDDCTLRIWSVSQRRSIKKLQLDYPISCISWSHNGQDILAGCGSEVGELKRKEYDGVFLLIDYVTLDIKLQGRDCRHRITAVKFSPDSKLFAIAATDHKLYIYDNSTISNHKLRVIANCDCAAIDSIDFSKDSYFIQAGSVNNEHIRYCTNDGEIMSLPSQLKDIKWESYTCKYGWHVQGIWALMKNIGQASEPTCADRSCNDLLAIGTSKGEVRLYQYPVTSNKSPFRSESLHTHDVKNCCFNSNGTFLITVGKHSKSIAVWKIEDMPKESHTIRHSSNNS